MSEHDKWNFEENDEIVPGRYALKSLGGGYRYEAYLAWDNHLHSLVVAKMLRPEQVTSDRALRTLRAEAEVLARLNHPVIMRSYDAVLTGPRPHLVLEFLEGPRLSSLLRKERRLALEQVVPLGLQLSSGIIYLHNKEMVHLDVKPRNIIMGGPPRLIDLSVARSFERAAHATEPIGTDAYMAPEQCEPTERGGMGPASDVWGWGVTMYEAISGTLPFPRLGGPETEERNFPQLHLDPLPLDENTPVALADVVMSCLAKNPDDRPTQNEVVEALEPLVAALPRRIALNRLKPRMR